MPLPTDLQNLINALPWTNGAGKLTGAEMQALWNECVAVLEAMGGTVWPTTGAPASGLGNNGDYAIDQTNKFIYGPKASGAWPSGTSFGGATGALLAANNLSDVASKATSFNNLSPMTTAGDIIYGGAAGAAQRLAAGTPVQVLYGGTTPSWGAPGLAEAATIAALQGLATSTGTALLTAAYRFGLFTWNSANLSTAVTNDPGQGIYIAPSSDTTGASGAWVRQYVGRSNIAWWGAVMDGQLTFPAVAGPPTIVSAGSSTANSSALANWGTWARYQGSIGARVYTEVPATGPGNAYCFDHSLCQYFAHGIPYLRWYNNGAPWFNIYSGSPNFAFNVPWDRLCQPLENNSFQTFNCLINQTSQGAFGFVAATASFSLFVLKQWVLLGSLDVQYNGFPPNMQQYEDVLINAITAFAGATATAATYTSSTGILSLTFATAPFGAAVAAQLNGIWFTVSTTGATNPALNSANWPIASTASSGTVINFQATVGLGANTLSAANIGACTLVQTAQPIRNIHLTTFPDDSVATGNAACGAARAWFLDLPLTINGIAYAYATWNLDHVWYDLNLPFPLTGTYWNFSGRSVRTENFVGCGFEATVCGDVFHLNPKVYAFSEEDKLIRSITYENMEYICEGGNISTNYMVFQSPIDRVRIANSTFSAIFDGSAVKNLHVDTCDFGMINLGTSGVGFSGTHIYENTRIGGVTLGTIWLMDGSITRTIDGTNVSFANGTLTVLKSAFPGSLGLWGAVPGMSVNLPTSVSFFGNIYTGIQGNGNVLAIREDSTNYYIDTDLPYATLPSWASGGITFWHNASFKFNRCTGCDLIQSASDAYDAGYEYWEYGKYEFKGAIGNNVIQFNNRWLGNLVGVTVLVRGAGTATNATIVIAFNTYQTASNYAADSPKLAITIVVGVVAGVGIPRVLTQGAFTGNQTGDTVTCNGSTITSTGLPSLRVVGPSLQITTSNWPTTNATAPRFELILQFDCGDTRKIIPTRADNNLGQLLANTTGRAQP